MDLDLTTTIDRQNDPDAFETGLLFLYDLQAVLAPTATLKRWTAITT